MGYVAYMRLDDKFIKVVTPQEFNLRKSQGWKLTLKSEYERSQLTAPQDAPTDAGGGDADYAAWHKKRHQELDLVVGHAEEIIDAQAAELATLRAQVAALTTERDAARARIAALEASLEPFAYEWEMFRNYATEQGGRADVGNYVTNYRDLDIIMNACERAFKARQAAKPAATESEGEA